VVFAVDNSFSLIGSRPVTGSWIVRAASGTDDSVPERDGGIFKSDSTATAVELCDFDFELRLPAEPLLPADAWLLAEWLPALEPL
jgi:hypothetical protein